jgi:hypothetical protein
VPALLKAIRSTRFDGFSQPEAGSVSATHDTALPISIIEAERGTTTFKTWALDVCDWHRDLS